MKAGRAAFRPIEGEDISTYKNSQFLNYFELIAFFKNCSTNWNNHLKSLGLTPEEGIKSSTYKNSRFNIFRLISYLYCAFHKHANCEVQKPTNDCIFRCRQSS